MKIAFIVLFFLMMLLGCTPKIDDVAYNCPLLKLPMLPALETKGLTSKSPNNVRAKAYVIDLKECRGWAAIVKKQVANSQSSSS